VSDEKHIPASGDAHASGAEHKKHRSHGHGGAHEEHEEGVPEWVVSFADNVLLQMGFFVILLAMNMGVKAQGPTTDGDGTTPAKQQENAMIDFAIAVREAFNSPVSLHSTAADDLPLIKRILEKQRRDQPTNSPERGEAGDDHSASSTRPSDFRSPSAYVEFDDRSTDLSPAALATLKDFATRYAGTRWIIEIRGHVSALEMFREIETSRRLAYDRTWAVGKTLAAGGLDWRQLRLTSVGDADPVQAGRAKDASTHLANQRVEVFVTPETLPPDPYSQAPDTAQDRRVSNGGR
jgi:outer membrane protein OmpA-like peptidoglycan-associated protein